MNYNFKLHIIFSTFDHWESRGNVEFVKRFLQYDFLVSLPHAYQGASIGILFRDTVCFLFQTTINAVM